MVSEWRRFWEARQSGEDARFIALRSRHFAARFAATRSRLPSAKGPMTGKLARRPYERRRNFGNAFRGEAHLRALDRYCACIRGFGRIRFSKRRGVGEGPRL